MTPRKLAAIHRACFTTPRPWGELEFVGFLCNPRTFLLTDSLGFALGRVVADEAELLTLAVVPSLQRKGRGKALLAAFLAEAARRGAVRAHLEVSIENAGAQAMYRDAGFVESGRRKAYFKTPEGARIDAILMSRALDPAGILAES